MRLNLEYLAQNVFRHVGLKLGLRMDFFYPPFLGLIYSNKKETSDFHGTVSFNLVKMFTAKIKPKCLSNVGHTKIGNYLILSSYLEGLLNLMCTQLFPLS